MRWEVRNVENAGMCAKIAGHACLTTLERKDILPLNLMMVNGGGMFACNSMLVVMPVTPSCMRQQPFKYRTSCRSP